MLHILTVVGARPQIIKAAALSRAIRNRFADKIRETIVHTGQHYDENMSQVFFDELEIPAPDYNLHSGSGSHNQQIAAMVAGLDEVLEKEKPQLVVVYGDTNSTLAGALAANKRDVPVVHVEAGMRSFNMQMPEEVNRMLTDRLSAVLFTPTATGLENLGREGLVTDAAAYHCGDVMYDNALYYGEVAEKKSGILRQENLSPGNYFLATIHRHYNTDDPERLSKIFTAFERLAEKFQLPVIFPIHPRTRKQLAMLPELEKRIADHKTIRLLAPASFLDMTLLEKNAKLILTDSGGVQKEAFFYQKPCVIVRDETEWVELVGCGAAILARDGKIEDAVSTLLQQKITWPEIFGDGRAAEFICSVLINTYAHE